MFANSTVSILRGTSVDDYGDELDNDTVAASGIPATILESGHPVSGDESSDLERTVRRFVLRLPRGTELLLGDRIGDESTGEIFLVDQIKIPRRTAITQRMIAWCKYVESVDVPTWPGGANFNPFARYYVRHVDGPTTSILLEHAIGQAVHTSVFVGNELVLATVTYQPNALNPLSTLVEFEDPQSDVTVVVSG